MSKDKLKVEMPAKYNYRYEDDVFYARPANRKYSSSIDNGEFIFDIGTNGEVVGIEILNASKILHVPKEALRNLISMKLLVVVSEEKIQISIQLKASLRNGQTSGSLFVDRDVPEFMQPSQLQMALV